MRQRRRNGGHSQIDLATQKIGNVLNRALIRHMGERDARTLSEELPNQVMRGAHPCAGNGEFAWVGLGEGNQFGY